MRRTAVLLLLLLLTVPTVAQDRITRADRAKMRETRETMRSLQLDLITHNQLHGKYPDDLKTLKASEEDKEVPKDAWGRDFILSLDVERGFILVSLGADGKTGGDGAAADIRFDAKGEIRVLTKDELEARTRERDEQRFQGQRAVSRQRMVALGTALVEHRRSSGSWPESLEALRRTGIEPLDAAFNACLADAWGNQYEFKLLPHENFAIICHGADSKAGGQGRDADFVVTERDVRAAYDAHRPRSRWSWDWDLEHDWHVRALANDVELYRQRFGRLPDELEDLTRGGRNSAGEAVSAVRTYLPRDEWGREYVYVKSGAGFHVIGLGADGIEGGKKDNRDTIQPPPGELLKSESYDDNWIIIEPDDDMEDDEETEKEAEKEADKEAEKPVDDK